MKKIFKWNVEAFRESFINWFILHAMTKSSKKNQEKILLKSGDKQKTKTDWIVTMQIDGVDVDAEACIKEMGRQFDEMVHDKAKEFSIEILDGKFSEAEDMLINLKEQIKKHIDPNNEEDF
jgi:hypothetical protein